MIGRVLFGLCASAVALSCGVYQSYKLPVPPAHAPHTFPAIASSAQKMGYTVAEFESSVHVKLADFAWAYFTIEMDEYNLVIQLDEDLVPEADRESRFLEARHKAQEIWGAAMKDSPQAINIFQSP